MKSIWRRLVPAVGFLLLACGDDAPSDSSEGAGGTATGGSPGSGGSTDGGAAESGGNGGEGAGTGDPCATVDCPDGETCDGGECVPGCATAQDCTPGLTCCAGVCVDVAASVDHCGQCDDPCEVPANTDVGCETGLCQSAGCQPGFYECNGIADDGCESDTACSCTPGEQQACYEGPPGTAGVGLCTEGYRICNQAGTAWSLCFDWRGPTEELCANSVDEDCSGTADDVPDLDGDGWTRCENDCCENTMDCSAPALVNVGAFEFVGNGVDDDCDVSTSDTVAASACSSTATFSNVAPALLTQAMDLCQTTTANPPLTQRKWGVINSELRLANGAVPSGTQLNNMRNWQGAVLQNYGTGGVVPQKGSTMAAISSGRMRDQNDPNYVLPNEGTDLGSVSQPPAAYLAANGGSLPSSAGCSGNCPAGSGANDSINLRLTIRVPTNALSFSYDFRFFSSEYWTYSCTPYNDFYLALLTSGAAGLPADKNISFDSLNNPVSVNNGFFESCVPKGCYSCPLGTGALAGTGMNVSSTGGGTSWLETTAPVVPGETMTLELMIFDVSDPILDSQTLLDAFEWSVQPSGVGTGPAG